MSSLPFSSRRNVYTAAAANGIGFAGFTIVMPFLPLYIRELGVADVADIALWTGLTLGATPAVTAFSAPLWGRVGDRYGSKVLLLRSLMAFVLTKGAMAFVTALGTALFLSAVNVRYRDVPYAIPFVLQIWLYLSGVVYAISSMPERWQWVLALNPMTAVISGFQWGVLGTAPPDLGRPPKARAMPCTIGFTLKDM